MHGIGQSDSGLDGQSLRRLQVAEGEGLVSRVQVQRPNSRLTDVQRQGVEGGHSLGNGDLGQGLLAVVRLQGVDEVGLAGACGVQGGAFVTLVLVLVDPLGGGIGAHPGTELAVIGMDTLAASQRLIAVSAVSATQRSESTKDPSATRMRATAPMSGLPVVSPAVP